MNTFGRTNKDHEDRPTEKKCAHTSVCVLPLRRSSSLSSVYKWMSEWVSEWVNCVWTGNNIHLLCRMVPILVIWWTSALHNVHLQQLKWRLPNVVHPCDLCVCTCMCTHSPVVWGWHECCKSSPSSLWTETAWRLRWKACSQCLPRSRQATAMGNRQTDISKHQG